VEIKQDEDRALIRIPEKILFDFDSSKLRSEAYPVLEKIAESLKEDGGKEFKVLIKGHTDSKGSDAYNMKLSQRRAEAVRKALVDRFGVPASMLTAKGYGEREPLVPNDTESNRQKNRRVEFVVEPK
jgi:outer membrane protein OmpA-like peptidoglycan-associated protein